MMKACEAEILAVTKYTPRKKYKNRQDYLVKLLREVDALPPDKFEHLISNQTYEWFKKAESAFKGFKPLPELPEVEHEELRYPRDDEGYVPSEVSIRSPEEHRADIKAVIDAQAKAEAALEELARASEKVRDKRDSKYRPPDPSEGARHYLYPETDRFGLIKGGQRQKAAELLERGATMKEIKEAVGYTTYNLIKKLQGQGHRVINSGGIIKLTHKEDLK